MPFDEELHKKQHIQKSIKDNTTIEKGMEKVEKMLLLNDYKLKIEDLKNDEHKEKRKLTAIPRLSNGS